MVKWYNNIAVALGLSLLFRNMVSCLTVFYNVFVNVSGLCWDLSIYTPSHQTSSREFNATSKPSNIIYLHCRVSPTISTT